ncbi:MAG: hypothetical protein IT452_23505 [Planctomycetia bacterium]|nr:hypothetical protein [Planctomycetia bacterium]
MRTALTLLLAAVLAAGCGKDSGSSSSSPGSSSGGSSAKRISGGQAQRFGGVTFDIPGSWKSQLNQGKLLVMPADANASGLLEELYGFVNDPSIKSLDGPQVEQLAQEFAGAGATRKSGPESKTFGDVEGRAWVYTFPAQGGKTAEIRLYGFMGNGGCAFVALGLPEALSKRESDIEAILASISKSAATAAGSVGVRQELLGQWIWISTNSLQGGGGSQSSTWIQFGADGRYKWHHDSVRTAAEGGVWGSQDESGRWSATDDSITFTPDQGAPYTQTLEKRNHPKNANDPMIVLNGQPYVTAGPRPPW